MEKGVCYGVSVGPGQGDLITCQAIAVIENADVIFLPSFPKEECRAYIIVKNAIPDIDNKNIMAETFTMSKDASVMKERHEEIFEKTKAFLEEGKSIAFLTLGEVSLYSTYLYIHEKLLNEGYESILINGISSIQAIAARLGVSLALGDEELHIFPNGDDIIRKLNYDGTKVFMKTRLGLRDLCNNIDNYCRNNPGTSAMGISNCGMEDEIIAKDYSELCNLKGYFTVIIVKKS